VEWKSWLTHEFKLITTDRSFGLLLVGNVEKPLLFDITRTLVSKALVKELDSETSDDWAKVYNQVMQRSLRFSPLSGRILEKMDEFLRTQAVTFLIGYQKMRPSAVCSYSIDEENHLLTIFDFCVLPVNRSAGVSMLDDILSIARNSGCTRVTAWLPATSTTSLDVLGEFLFTPGNAMALMRCFLDKAPTDYDVEIEDLTSDEESSDTLLPFQYPFHMQSLLESLMSPWKISYVAQDVVEQNDAMEIYLTNKLRQQAWIFPVQNSEMTVKFEHLSGTAAYLYDIGVRDILTEVESGDVWQKPFKDLGFERVVTRFEVFFDLFH
jgi:hypothetical protein